MSPTATHVRTGRTTHYWRRGGNWDLAAERALVDERGCDPFVLRVLEAITAGREYCGGCRRLLQTTSEAALIAVWVADDAHRVCGTAYCLPCVTAHADDIADAS